MPEITTSIETCVRYFENNIKRNDFLTFQVKLPKDISREVGLFSVESKEYGITKNILSQQMRIFDEHIIFNNSHEDPIVCDEKYIYLSLHIPTEIIPDNFEYLEISLNGLGENSFSQKFFNNSLALKQQLISNIDIKQATIVSNEDTLLTLHLGDERCNYKEEYFNIKANEIFNFKEYINQYVYIGVQCSYENKTPEVEEKHIIKGQKGIYETAILRENSGNIISEGLLPFNHIFLNNYQNEEITTKGFKEIQSLNELLDYHQKNPIQYFESSLNFLYPQYKAKNTYSQSRLFKRGEIKRTHMDLKICKECPFNTECIQVVPSGLSSELFRKNLLIKEHSDCVIYELIKEKKA